MHGLSGRGLINVIHLGFDPPARGTRLLNSVAINTNGVEAHADDDFVATGLTLVNPPGFGVKMSVQGPIPEVFEIRLDLRNSIILGGDIGLQLVESPSVTSFVHRFNNLSGMQTPYAAPLSADATEMAMEPGFDAERFGSGAYLIRSTILSTLGENSGSMGAGNSLPIRQRRQPFLNTSMALADGRPHHG
ncbi:MAG: hypothetical protein R3C68_12700 [Myxococcota bacterium]